MGMITKSKNSKSASTTKWRPLFALDFDTWEQYRAFPERARFVLMTFVDYSRRRQSPIRRFRIRRFRSHNRKWHVVVYVRSARLPSPILIVALQAILGSDWKRETFNLYRARQLPLAPQSWRLFSAWNTLYREKL